MSEITKDLLRPFLVNEAEAAKLLGLSVHTLQRDRYSKKKIPFVTIGKSIRYSPETLHEWALKLTQGGK